MIIRRIEARNVGPFLGEWMIDLKEGVTAVVGEYEDAPDSSNRSGKSYVAVDLPLYVLHGWHRGKSADSVVHRLAAGKEDATASITVETSEGQTHLLHRGRSAKGNPIRVLDGRIVSEDDFEEAVREEILGLSLTEHRMTTAMVQGKMSEFMELAAAEKRRIVSPWFKTDRWIPRADLARTRLTKAKANLGRKKAREEELVERIAKDDVDELELRRTTLVDEIKQFEITVVETEGIVKKVEKEYEGIEATNAERKKLSRELDVADEDIRDAIRGAKDQMESGVRVLEGLKKSLTAAASRETKIKELERRVSGLDAARKVVDDLNAEITKFATEGNDAEVDRIRLGKVYKKLEIERTGLCPVLGESCDRIDAKSADLPKIKTEGLGLVRRRDRSKKQAETLMFIRNNAEGDVRQLEESRSELDDLREQSSRKEIESKIERAKETALETRKRVKAFDGGKTERQIEVEKLRKRFDDIPVLDSEDLRERLRKVRIAASLAREARSDFDRRLTDVNVTIASVNEMTSDLKKTRKEIKEITAEVENLAWTSYAFGATGIPSRELENAFGVAEDEMNLVLEDLRTPLRVAFAPDRELKDWEPACLGCGLTFPKGERKHVCVECGSPRRKRRRDELALGVVDRGADTDFDLDSGGGKVMISIGVRLGLVRLPSASRKVCCQTLVVDEADAALDGPNRQRLHAALRRVDRVGIRQVLLITHSDVRREFDQVVVAHRWDEDGYSGFWNE